MKTKWSIIINVTLVVLFIIGAGVFYVQAKDQVAETRRIDQLEKEFEVFNQTFCDTIFRLSEVDTDLIAAGAVKIPGRSEPLFDKIYSTQAYCRNAVFVSIDVRQAPGSKIIFQDTEVTSHLRSFIAPDEDFEIILVNERGSVSVNPKGFLEKGDFMKVWVSSEKPKIAAFYDEVTGLAISILHINGSIELFVYD